MKPVLIQVSRVLGSVAISSALLLSIGCDSTDSVEPTYPTALETKKAPEGQPVAAGEASKISNAPDIDIKDYLPPVETSSPRVVDKASLIACNINFNDSFALSLLPEQAWTTFALSPFYIQNCGDSFYWVYTTPLNMNHYHLGFEFQSTVNFCNGPQFKVGQVSGANCINQKDAKLWPRNASNMQSGSGIQFYARNSDSTTKRLFNLKSIKIVTGPAIVKVFRTDINSWWQWELPAGTWTFPTNGTNLRFLEVYHKQFDGIFTIDDVKLDVQRI